tara:strand:+ start:672 stop:884 length:213 start_codon:yes stop_codon:yes gene_type:complete
MGLTELLARIEYFLVNQDGLSVEQINAMRVRPDYLTVLLPHIENIFANINNGEQTVVLFEQNKNILIGGQ